MLTIWLEDAEDRSKRLLTDGLKKIWHMLNMQLELFLCKSVRMKIPTQIIRIV